MNTRHPHPVKFQDFEALYLEHLGAKDSPTGYIAYLRAEAEVESQYQRRRFLNYHTFRTVLYRHRLKQRKSKQQHASSTL